MSALTALVPWPYRVLAVIALAVALAGFGWVKGASHVQAKWDAAVTAQTVQVAKVEKQQSEATVKVVTKYVDRIKVVRESGKEIVRNVPIYITKEADAGCTINNGFVRLHDAAAAGSAVPGTTGSSDEEASGVALSTVAETVSENYGTCHEVAAQLEALQEWVRAQRDVTSNGAASMK